MTKLTEEATRDEELETAFGTTGKLGLQSGIGATVAVDSAPGSWTPHHLARAAKGCKREAKSRRVAPSAPSNGPSENEGPGTTEEDSPPESPSDLVRQALSTMDPGYSSDDN